jgi:tetratricopeptide (TPR) repeat protein
MYSKPNKLIFIGILLILTCFVFNSFAIESNNDSEFWVNQSIYLGESGDYEGSLVAADTAIKFCSNDAVAWEVKGVTLSKMDRNKEALMAFTKAAELSPISRNFLHIASTEFDLKKYSEALKYYDIVLKMNSSNGLVWQDKGLTLHKLGRYDEAIKAYDISLAINPNDADAYSKKGQSLRALNKFEEALTAYEQAIDLNDSNSLYWNNKGNTLWDLKRYEEALDSFEKATNIDPENALAWRNNAVLLYKLKRNAEADYACNKAKELGSSDSCKPLVSKPIWIIINILLFITCLIFVFFAFFRTKKTVQWCIKRKHLWYNKILPSKLYEKKNYTKYIKIMGWLYLFLAIVILLTTLAVILIYS